MASWRTATRHRTQKTAVTKRWERQDLWTSECFHFSCPLLVSPIILVRSGSPVILIYVENLGHIRLRCLFDYKEAQSNGMTSQHAIALNVLIYLSIYLVNSMKLVIPLHSISWKNKISDISCQCILPNMIRTGTALIIYLLKCASC